MTTSMANQQISASHVEAVEPPTIGANTQIIAENVTLGRNVRIGANVQIICDRLELGDNVAIGSGSHIICPEIRIARDCSLGDTVNVSLNDHFRLGSNSNIGARTQITGRGMSCGVFLWMKNDVIVGGGGSQGPNSFLHIGDRSSVFDEVFINLSDQVRIGDNTALSFGSVILTHGAWQPALQGNSTAFGPVTIGNDAVIYVRAVILPAVSIGHYATIGANAVVGRDVPDRALAVGNPAKIVPRSRTKLSDRAKDRLISSIMLDYARTLEPKGATIRIDDTTAYVLLAAQFGSSNHTILYVRDIAAQWPAADITLAFGASPVHQPQRSHFDLQSFLVTGSLTALGEDFRDYLRRRTIQFHTGKAFSTLPLANVDRLRKRKQVWQAHG